MPQLIIGSRERQEAKALAIIRDGNQPSGMALFLRMALTEYDVRVYDEDEGISVANGIVFDLDVLHHMKLLQEGTSNIQPLIAELPIQ